MNDQTHHYAVFKPYVPLSAWVGAEIAPSERAGFVWLRESDGKRTFEVPGELVLPFSAAQFAALTALAMREERAKWN
jgi:hypothetical protein